MVNHSPSGDPEPDFASGAMMTTSMNSGKGGEVCPVFKPAWWCRHPHQQTLWPIFARRRLKVNYHRQRLELKDGDFLDLDWSGPVDHDRPVVLVLHGLEGSSQSHYIRGVCSVLSQHQFRTCVMHFRGCSGENNRLPRTYHAGETNDLDYVIRWLHRHNPDVPLFAVGYSLGGNMLLKLLGQKDPEIPLAAAAAISVPFELSQCASRLEKGLSRLYQHWLVGSMKKTAIRKAYQHNTGLNIPALLKTRTFREFDNLGTAPLHGFRDAEHYYATDSCRQYLLRITTPTLIVQAKDDPFMTQDLLPEEHELGPGIRLELSDRGGHTGFVEGHFPGRSRYWLEIRLARFLTQANSTRTARRSENA